MRRLASNSRVAAARKSAARTLPEVFSICHAVSNAAVKTFVASGSKKPALVINRIIGISSTPSWAGARLVSQPPAAYSLSSFADDEAVSAYLGRVASTVSARLDAAFVAP
jgi:hypothetical protein